MSGAAAAPPSAHAPRARRAGPAVRAAPAGGALGLRLAAFGALCVYAVGHWGGLVDGAPASRLGVVAGIATGAGALLAAVPWRGARGTAARLALAAAALAAGLTVVGLEPRLLLPGNWDELGEGLDQGLAGLRTVDWPYGGTDEWVRLVLLLGAPALAVPAALLAFWPARRAGPLRTAGLLLLLLIYGVAVTERDFGAELLSGAGLALLVGAWLWAPHARGREAGTVAAALAAATLFAVPVAASLDRDAPWIDYRQWNWFGAIGGTAFDWSHSYGPIDWSRDGTTLLRVKADRALYWKVEVLDRFDGFRWVRSGVGAETPPSVELPEALNPAWEESAEFTVRELRSDLAVVTGTPLRGLEGLGATDIAVDGTTTPREGQLREGDSYTVHAYVPNPSRGRLRDTPEYWNDYFRRYLRIDLPAEGVTNLDGTGRAGDAARAAIPPELIVALPFRGEPRPAEAAATERLLRESPYSGTFALARRLTAGAPTTYDAVKAIETYLLEELRYSERPPSQEYPLEAFLFEDRAGYCQQFSGAMALMLRMAGIPARVVGGFAPGSFNRDDEEFRVRDLDAHSWVEVYFSGVGWVQFDPTPSGTPAQSRAEPRESASSATGSTDPGRGEGVAAERGSDTAQPGAAGGGGDALPFWALPAMLAGLVGLGILAAWLLPALGRRRGQTGAEGPLLELTRALRRLGYPLPADTTLLVLERRLGRVAGPRSAAYVRALRGVRYGGNGAVVPGAAERRALRSELGRRRGPAGRLRSWLALPPFRRS